MLNWQEDKSAHVPTLIARCGTTSFFIKKINLSNIDFPYVGFERFGQVNGSDRAIVFGKSIKEVEEGIIHFIRTGLCTKEEFPKINWNEVKPKTIIHFRNDDMTVNTSLGSAIR